jgi:BirA family biotin operon repressor/biotin-[acetyl-CoA-carboxylase] ligase
MTLLERPSDPAALALLSIRLGVKGATVLDRYAPRPVRLKWPNDLLLGRRKLAGILVEARWRDQQIDWVAIGLGINVHPHEGDAEAAALRDDTRRIDVLAELVPVLRAAAQARGSLTTAELDAWNARDDARGRRCRAPLEGRVRGVSADGALIIEHAGTTSLARTGSLILEDEP